MGKKIFHLILLLDHFITCFRYMPFCYLNDLKPIMRFQKYVNEDCSNNICMHLFMYNVDAVYTSIVKLYIPRSNTFFNEIRSTIPYDS